MEIPAPRRPRRWSSACSGTFVRCFVGVVLVALIAWPERHCEALAPGERTYRNPEYVRSFELYPWISIPSGNGGFSDLYVRPPEWLHRDAGLHVLIDIIRDVIDG